MTGLAEHQGMEIENKRERISLRSRLDALQNRYAPYWLLLPGVAIIVAVLLYPLIHALYISFFDYKLARSARPFVGLGNYIEAVTSVSFGTVLAQNIVFAVACILVEFTLAMSAALLLNRKFRGRALYRVFLLLPMLTAPVLAGFNWRWIFNDRFGLMNQIFIAAGLPPQGWLVDPNLARLAIVIATVWQGIPFVMILLLAGLQALPQAPFEAATVDGASPWQRFSLLTMPLMRPVIAVALALRIIDLFRVFDVIYIMTLGGPGHATELLPFYIYRAAFSQSQFGLASALSWITVFITIALLIPLFMNERSGAESEKLNR
jgi:multiple sugar transport system permease protein